MFFYRLFFFFFTVKVGPFLLQEKIVNMITTTITSGLVMVILTPTENAVGVIALNLEFNTHFEHIKNYYCYLCYAIKPMTCFRF